MRLAVAAALLVHAGMLSAQEPAPPARPVEQAQRAAQQVQTRQQMPAEVQNPAAQGQQLGPPPASHTVQEGETLWSLAQQFFGDALLWPEIYRLNTDVIEDPHWIFPGEELRLVASAPSPAQPSDNLAITPGADSVRRGPPQTAQEAMREAPTVFSQRASVGEQQAAVRIAQENAYRAVRAGEHYAAGFLAEVRSLRTGTLVGNVERVAIRRLSTRTTASLYAEVVVAPPEGDSLRRGDLLLTFSVGPTIRDHGEIILPTGLLRVTSDAEAGGNAVATVTALYGPVNSGQRLIKVQPFAFDARGRPQPTDSGVVGQLIALRSGRELAALQEPIYIDRGADDGVRLGDVFRVTSAASDSPGGVARDVADAQVVYTRAHTATCIIIDVIQPEIRRGATVRQVRRMPT